MITLCAHSLGTSRSGLTLVELLAALAILSVFVGAVSAWTSGAARLSASAARETESAAAVSNVAELLRRDLAERPIEPTLANAARGQPNLPYEVVVNPEALSITLVTASHARAVVGGKTRDPFGGGGGWWTVAWRYDASRGELLRGSWPFERGHATSSPVALSDAPGTRVALRGIRAFRIVEVEITHEEDGPTDSAAPSAPISVWVAEITLESGERASIVIDKVSAAPSGGAP
jgi:prepilin-type N-terminal cleavage/methylation domain-containing protein